MDPITMGVISGGLSILGGIEQNKAITKAATASYNANQLFIQRDQAVTTSDLLFNAGQVNEELGMQLSGLYQQANQAFSSVAATQAETNIYGATAARAQQVTKIKAELTKDSMVQAAETNMTEIQNQLRNNKYEAENRHAQNAQSYNNAMSQRQSTLGMLTNAAGAAMSGYSAVQGINATQEGLKYQQSMRDMLEKQAQASGSKYSNYAGGQYG